MNQNAGGRLSHQTGNGPSGRSKYTSGRTSLYPPSREACAAGGSGSRKRRVGKVSGGGGGGQSALRWCLRNSFLAALLLFTFLNTLPVLLLDDDEDQEPALADLVDGEAGFEFPDAPVTMVDAPPPLISRSSSGVTAASQDATTPSAVTQHAPGAGTADASTPADVKLAGVLKAVLKKQSNVSLRAEAQAHIPTSVFNHHQFQLEESVRGGVHEMDGVSRTASLPSMVPTNVTDRRPTRPPRATRPPPKPKSRIPAFTLALDDALVDAATSRTNPTTDAATTSVPLARLPIVSVQEMTYSSKFETPLLSPKPAEKPRPKPRPKPPATTRNTTSILCSQDRAVCSNDTHTIPAATNPSTLLLASPVFVRHTVSNSPDKEATGNAATNVVANKETGGEEGQETGGAVEVVVKPVSDAEKSPSNKATAVPALVKEQPTPEVTLADYQRRKDEKLPPKYRALLWKLYQTPLLLDQQKVLEGLKISHKRFTCGGSEVVRWRDWADLKSMIDFRALNLTLPKRQPLLPALAKQVKQSSCFNHTVYKRKDCDMERDLFTDDPELRDFPRPSCAVVGNSGRLRFERNAKLIDTHDVVIRFNAGRTQGFEKWVGSKSSFRMFNGAYVGPKQGGEVTVAQMRDEALRTWVGHVLRRGVDNSLAFIFHPEFLCSAWEWVGRQGKKPSSGLVGILFAIHMCRRGEVSVFGFQYDAYFNKQMRPHYFDWERPKPGREDVHPFSAEKEVLEMLEAAGELRLYI